MAASTLSKEERDRIMAEGKARELRQIQEQIRRYGVKPPWVDRMTPEERKAANDLQRHRDEVAFRMRNERDPEKIAAAYAKKPTKQFSEMSPVEKVGYGIVLVVICMALVIFSSMVFSAAAPGNQCGSDCATGQDYGDGS
ncbi:MAG: hypothetical protein ACR2OO_10600 [Thermomicrobiales bacterium]